MWRGRMETILEQQRRYHEERERLMDVMVKEMLTKKSTVRPGPRRGGGVAWRRPRPRPALTPRLSPQLRDQINSDHRTRAMQDVSAPAPAPGAGRGLLGRAAARAGLWRAPPAAGAQRGSGQASLSAARAPGTERSCPR